MHNTIKLTIQLFFLSIPLHIVCMKQNELQEYRHQCITIRQKGEEKLQRYKNKFKVKDIQELTQEKNKLENTRLLKSDKLVTRVEQHNKINTISWDKEKLVTLLDIHQSSGSFCIAENNMCTHKLPIFLLCYNEPDTASFMVQNIPQKYSNNFMLHDYAHICKINTHWEKLAYINSSIAFKSMINICKTLSILRKLNSHIPQNK
jgi:hypothetical protein